MLQLQQSLSNKGLRDGTEEDYVEMDGVEMNARGWPKIYGQAMVHNRYVDQNIWQPKVFILLN